MRLIHVIGCCLTLAIVLTPSDAFGWWGKSEIKPKADPKPTGDVKEGVMKDKKPAVPQANPPQKTPAVPQANPPQKTPAVPQANPPQKAVGDSKTDTGTKPDTVPTITVDKKIMANPKSQAVVAVGATTVAAAQHQLEKNQKETKKLETKLEKLDKEMKTNIEDESLSDLTRTLADVAKRRVKIKAALVTYGIINFILYIAQFAGSIITPPIGKFIYFLDILAKKVISQPLDNYYADFQKAQAEAVAQYVNKHNDEFKSPKIGKKVLVRTNSGKQKYILLKKNPGDPVDPKFLSLSNKGAFEVMKIAAQV